MSITDELRKWWLHKFPVMDKELHEDFTAIADRIDATNEKAMSRAGQLLADAEKDRDYNYANWQECKQKVLQGNITFDELNAKIECLEDELAHRIELPKDADGEYIHMGDLVTVPWKDKVYEVAGFSCSKQLCSGIRTIWIVVYSQEKQRIVPLCGADSCRHYHAPTVEDVLREMLDAWGELPSNATNDAIVAEYAKRLTLAKEDA